MGMGAEIEVETDRGIYLSGIRFWIPREFSPVCLSIG